MARGAAPISKYRRVLKKPEPAQDNEVRIRIDSPPFVYLAYAAKLLLVEKSHPEIYLKATGAATPHAIKIAEYLRIRIAGSAA
jgi:DNA-binding protein